MYQIVKIGAPIFRKTSQRWPLTLAPTLLRTKQERELRSVACVTTFQAVQKVS